MKKLLLIFLFGGICVLNNATASVRSVANSETASAVANNAPTNFNIPAPVDRFDNEADFKKYLIERLRSAVIMKQDPNSGSYGGNATSVVEDKLPDEYKEKTFYEQVYEEAIKRATAKPDSDSQILDPRILQPELWEKNPQSQSSSNTIAVALPPYDEKVLVPPYEHIPYLFTKIEVLPSGLLKIDETIMVISNGQKLRYPLSKALPTHMVDRDGKGHKIDVTINEVTINGHPVDYKLISKGGNIIITPNTNIPLDAGIYKYEFSYVVDRQIAHYEKFDELNWDVSGGNWNLIISRIGATVILPHDKEALAQRALVGYPFHYSHERAIMKREAKNIIGFSSKVPLFIAEGMPITVILPKEVVEKISLSKQLDLLLLDYGTIIIPLLGFLMIAISYIFSWKYIQKNNKKLPIKLNRTPYMLRLLLNQKFDKRAFGAFLLDMFKKNIIDIQRNEKQIMLIKRTDNLRRLPKKERKALQTIFAKESVFIINSTSMPILKKAMELVAQNTVSTLKLFTFKLSSLYLLFGCGMLIFTELFTVYTMIESSKRFSAMLAVTISIAVYLILFTIKWKKKWLDLLIKLFSTSMILFNFVMLSGICSLGGALLVLMSCITIIFFNNLYRQRNGLIKANIAEAKQLQNYLTENSENIILGRNFINHQANIFATETENKYPVSNNIREYYRLDIIKAVVSKM